MGRRRERRRRRAGPAPRGPGSHVLDGRHGRWIVGPRRDGLDSPRRERRGWRERRRRGDAGTPPTGAGGDDAPSRREDGARRRERDEPADGQLPRRSHPWAQGVRERRPGRRRRRERRQRHHRARRQSQAEPVQQPRLCRRVHLPRGVLRSGGEGPRGEAQVDVPDRQGDHHAVDAQPELQPDVPADVGGSGAAHRRRVPHLCQRHVRREGRRRRQRPLGRRGPPPRRPSGERQRREQQRRRERRHSWRHGPAQRRRERRRKRRSRGG
mmetsp:Transcript_3599/g.14446  ORF Transcript_3599/g.14446 Transcript_3599/m.14446 type:complete len:268 (-) Transcript_3599:759-1562(-)